MLSDFHFLRPAWLLAVLLVPVALMVWRRTRSEAGAWRSMVDAHLLPHLLEHSGERVRAGGAWLAAAIWILACIAIAGPAWERISLPLYRNDAARVIALELAPTILAADIKPTRLERARYKINDILLASRDMQTALIGYAGDAFVAAPLTDDINTVRNLVDALDPSVMPVAGNSTERAIAQALLLIEQAGLKRGELIVLADSVSNRALNAAHDAHVKGLTISVLGIGTTTGAPVPLPSGGFLQDSAGNIVLPRLDEAKLRAFAEAGGGRYASLSSDRTDIDALLSMDRSRGGSAASDGKGATSDRFLDRGPWFVLLLLPLALFAFRRGWLLILPLVLLAPVREADAFSFTDLWLRSDQQAAKALADGDAERAMELAKDPALRGSAAYRAGKFDEAGEAWAASTGADAEYNKGNALAKQGKFDDALAAYARALETDPGMEDALANKKAVEEWLERQKSQDDQKQNGDKGEKGDQKKDDKSDPSKSDSSESQDSDSKESAENGEPKDGDKDKPDQQESTDKKDGTDEQSDPSESDESNKSEEQRAAEEQQKADQQQELSQAIDKALDEQPEKQGEPHPVPTPAEESAREQQQAMQQWLERVPDDPGGLLRRKFQLENERRKRGGGGG